MWKVTLVMINFAGLGEGFADGAVDGVGVSVGVGSELGVVLTVGVEGVASGEFAACCWLNVQPLNAKTTATTDAETTPLMPEP